MKDISFIWDLDGTLVDSYDVIAGSLYQVSNELNLNYDKTEIRKEVIRNSVSYFIDKIIAEKNIDFNVIKDRYSEITDLNNDKIVAMKNAILLLDKLNELGIKSYLFTHRGKSTNFVLENTKLSKYFKEVVTSKSGFKRKPEPDAINYLVNKYNLNKDNTYYVGDRSIDIMCANNANIKSILFLGDGITKPSGKETYVIDDLIKILDIFDLNNN